MLYFFYRLFLLTLAFILTTNSILAQESKLIEPKKLLKDFEVVLEMITAHPDPHAHIEKSVFDRKVDSVRATLNKPLTTLDFYKKTAFVVAMIRDGHSSVKIPESWMNEQREKAGCFPYEMHLSSDDNLFVLKNLSDGPMAPGARVISINGMAIKSFLSAIDPYISYEKKSFRNTVIDNDFEQYLYLAFNTSADLTFEYFSTDTVKTVVKNMNFKEWKKFQNNDEEEREELMSKGKPYSYEKVDDGVGLIHIYGFYADNLTAYESFLHKTFKDINKDSIHSLIIDIRGNYGGWPKIASELFHYIYDGYFKTIAKSSAKVSYPYRRFFYEQYPSLRADKPNIKEDRHYVDLHGILSKETGSFIDQDILYNEEPITKAWEFKGDTYLMTNRDSYSAASSFASTFQCYSMGLIIGEETGGTKIFRANPIYIRLKRSEIMVAMSTTKLYTPCYSEEFMGVIPNVEYRPSILQLVSDLDTQLHFTKRVIKKVRKQRQAQEIQH